ncbi:MAG: aminoglycoside phosphotransferase family protein [Candidatus Heimdallarchaeota archaeon]|nr:aminoglycoside phosphotransferase family protein [Candidatus Heimdallarchaeota archaeon]
MDLPLRIEEILKTKIEDFKELNVDSINQIFEVKTNFSEYILKVMTREPLDDWEKNRFVRSKYILELVLQNDIPVNVPIFASTHSYDYYHSYLLMTKDEGVSLKELWQCMTQTQKNQFTTEFANILNLIHSITIDKLTLLKEYPISDNLYWKAWIKKKLLEIEDKINVLNYFNSSFKTSSMTFLFSNLKYLDDRKLSLVHYDLNQNNILVNLNDRSINVILDWEWAILGDPLIDYISIKQDLLAENDEALNVFNSVYLYYEEDQISHFLLLYYEIFNLLNGACFGYLYHNPSIENYQLLTNKVSTLINQANAILTGDT